MLKTVLMSLMMAGAAVLGAESAPEVGAAAPGVSLTSNEGKAVKLDDYRGKWVVLYFYPKDFTGG